MSERYDLQRFVDAQNEFGTYEQALAELRAGQKRSHWMWFVFPQVAGLGHSSTAQWFALASLAHAQAYVAHPVLGPRLRASAQIVADLRGRTAPEIFGGVDAQKLRSSMTLFARAVPGEPAFQQVLDQYFDGRADELTLQILGVGGDGSAEG